MNISFNILTKKTRRGGESEGLGLGVKIWHRRSTAERGKRRGGASGAGSVKTWYAEQIIGGKKVKTGSC